MEFGACIITPKLDGVILHCPYFHEPIVGTLCITGHHLILQSRRDLHELWLLHHSIDCIEKSHQRAQSQNGGTITIKCKDFRILYLDVAQYDEFQNICVSIERLSNLNNTELLYPFFYRPMYNIFEDGYTLFRPEIEFSKLITSDEWRVSYVNKNYTICNTYGTVLVVPRILNDEDLIASARFREGGRFPVLCYRHQNGTALLRSSQPLLNNYNRRCRADEKVLSAVLSPFQKGYIIDTRSASYINSSKGKGGGTEPDGHYTQWKKVFKPLDKISKCDGSLLDSLSKLIFDYCEDYCEAIEIFLENNISPYVTAMKLVFEKCKNLLRRP